MAAWMKCSVLSLKISDIGGTRRADEIQHQTPNLVGCARFYNVSRYPNIMFIGIK